ncbi:MAG: hypothetical protein K2J63_08700, partial [Muribaculaceae bacterium]|nr:hypothetical protein [Muribaculaceae bacterium]
LDNSIFNCTDAALAIDETTESEDIDENISIDTNDDVLSRDFSCNADNSYEDGHGAPRVVVVFGKSAMLAGGVGKKNVLFINPKYDSEWPWKKQYYADQKQARQYHCDKYDYESGFMETVLWTGTEDTSPWRYSRRFGLITDGDYIGEFWNRYPCLTEVNCDLKGDTVGLAKFICEFAHNELTYPLEEVYEAIRNLPGRNFHSLNRTCDFIDPVKLDNITALGIRFGAPMANGQSGYKLKVAEGDHTLPLENIHTRRELNALRVAIVRAGERLKENEPAQKRILIVPDYFTPYDSPNVKKLYDCLKQRGYYVAISVAGNNLEKSRHGLERGCKDKPFDLIVTLDSGCLLATRVTNCQRIFVNPDWNAWKRMKGYLGNNRESRKCRGINNSGPFFTYYLNSEEIALARQMAERAYMKRGDKPVYGWFTVDAVESHLPEEHLRRFNTSTYIPDLRLDTEEGLSVLAQQIDNVLTADHDE